jgi:hypothetical protein
VDHAETLSASDAVQVLSRATDASYHLVGRLAGGETGAHELVGPDGKRLVAKWDVDPRNQDARRVAVGLTERLRENAGWPVPHQQMVNADKYLFVLQEFMPGSPMESLTEEILDELIELHQKRIGLARPEDHSDWPMSLLQTLTMGGRGYCVHESLLNYDARTATMLRRIQQIGHEVDPLDFPGGDVVHWDLHLGNALQLDGHLSAIVDTDFAQTGDAAFDLVTLAIASLTVPCEPGVREHLFEHGIESLDEARRSAYIAHLLLRIIDWPIRRGRIEEIEFWLIQADRLLPN